VYKSQKTNVWIILGTLAFLTLSTPSIAKNKPEATQQGVNTFVRLLNKNYTPTLVDYQTIKGYSDFAEMQFYWKQCDKKHDEASLREDKCFSGMAKNWQNKKESKSYYLVWLRTLLPLNPKVNIVSKQDIAVNKQIKGTRVIAKLNDELVTFWLPADKKQYKALGRVNITEINGVPIQALQQQAAESSVLIAMGMKNLLRPLTKQEIAHKKEQREQRCKASSECSKRMVENKKHRAEHDRQQKISTQIGAAYKKWCEKNKRVCEKQKESRKHLFTKVKGLETMCEKDYEACMPKVLAFVKENKAQMEPFCKDNKNECQMVETLRQARHAESKLRCKEDKNMCGDLDSPYNLAFAAANK